MYYFGGVVKGDVIDKANGTAIQNIPPFKVMKAMEIHLPTIEEQTEEEPSFLTRKDLDDFKEEIRQMFAKQNTPVTKTTTTSSTTTKKA